MQRAVCARTWAFLITLAALTGSTSEAQVWRYLVGSAGGIAKVVVILPGNDPVVGGRAATGGPGIATVVRLSGGTGSEVWSRNVHGSGAGGDDEVRALATDAGGTSVYVAGRVRNTGTSWDFTVARLSAADGSVVWQREIDGAATDPDDFIRFDEAYGVTVDAAGDVIAAGGIIDAGTYPSYTVFKLSGVDGSTIWESQLDASTIGVAGQPIIDASGDVIVRGSILGNVVIAKLDGDTGTEVWRYGWPGSGFSMTLDPSGAVLAFGYKLIQTGPTTFFDNAFAAKVDPSNGAEIWQTLLTEDVSLFAEDLVADAAGDVVLGAGMQPPAGQSGNFGVLKLSGADGSEVWRSTVGGPGGWPWAVGIDAAGDIFAAGRSPSTSSLLDDFTVAKFAAADGALRWHRLLDGGAHNHDVAMDLAIDSAGDVVAAGGLDDGPEGFGQKFAAVKLSGLNGGGYPRAGSSFKMRDIPPRPRKLSLASSDQVLGSLDPASDPTTGGATLEVTNPTTAEQATMPLPAAGWIALGTPPGARGYRYKDREQAFGPCKSAKLDAKRTKVRCDGPGIAFSLDEPSQGGLSVKVRTGTSALARCFFFGGIRKDVSGTFTANKASPPASCP